VWRPQTPMKTLAYVRASVDRHTDPAPSEAGTRQSASSPVLRHSARTHFNLVSLAVTINLVAGPPSAAHGAI
jgi:hypothetical protein